VTSTSSYTASSSSRGRCAAPRALRVAVLFVIDYDGQPYAFRHHSYCFSLFVGDVTIAAVAAGLCWLHGKRCGGHRTDSPVSSSNRRTRTTTNQRMPRCRHDVDNPYVSMCHRLLCLVEWVPHARDMWVRVLMMAMQQTITMCRIGVSGRDKSGPADIFLQNHR
jgi:hypothetical protein